MRLHSTQNAAAFLRMAGDFLVQQEAVRNLPLAVARRCVDDPQRYRGPNYFAVVEGADGVDGVALTTPPKRGAGVH
jgi:hypothetical protein